MRHLLNEHLNGQKLDNASIVISLYIRCILSYFLFILSSCVDVCILFFQSVHMLSFYLHSFVICEYMHTFLPVCSDAFIFFYSFVTCGCIYTFSSSLFRYCHFLLAYSDVFIFYFVSSIDVIFI